MQASFHAEAYLSKLLDALSARGADSHNLVLRDYDLRIIDTLGCTHRGKWGRGKGRGGEGEGGLGDDRQDCVAIGIVAVVAAISESEGMCNKQIHTATHCNTLILGRTALRLLL